MSFIPATTPAPCQARTFLLKPRPQPIPKVTPAPSTNAQTNSPAPSNDSIPMPSLTVTPTNSNSDAALLSVKRELLVAAPAKKTHQPSVKPMCIGTKVTPHNLCALDWQAKGHQCEPASAFTLYWNNLSASIKEEYKQMAAAQAGTARMSTMTSGGIPMDVCKCRESGWRVRRQDGGMAAQCTLCTVAEMYQDAFGNSLAVEDSELK
ncbi:hypothetical protein BDR05DRAFT_951811 [Suillus weaverae]|nr:hypothetical protein BDR05DRAFT_951811 [Suillus weaverae]